MYRLWWSNLSLMIGFIKMALIYSEGTEAAERGVPCSIETRQVASILYNVLGMLPVKISCRLDLVDRD